MLHNGYSIVLPATLDGLIQSPPTTSNLLNVHHDRDALKSWLSEFQNSPNTYRAYEKEGLRFLYWLHIEYQCTFAEVRKNHIHAYRVFLMNPQPAEFWCTPHKDRKNSRKQQQWRPFSGPLGLRSIQTAMTILSGLFEYLRDAAYVPANPFSLIKQKVVETFDLEERKIQMMERILTLSEFQLLYNALYSDNATERYSPSWIARSRFILLFMGYLGLRVSEFVNAKWDNFIYRENCWWIIVTGKGRKTARVPVNNHCLDAINQYRAAFDLPMLSLESLNNDPICFSFLPSGQPVFEKPLTQRSVHMICRAIADLAIQNGATSSAFEHFSPHWLRHFSASMQAQSDIPFAMIKAHHRHSKDETTRIYLHHDDKIRHDWSQKYQIPIKTKP